MSPLGPAASGGGGAGGGGAGDGGGPELRPAELERFAGRVDELEQSVAEAREALRRLAETPLATGSGEDNLAMSAWYRDLLAGDTAPAADELARELDGVRAAVRAGAAAWEEADRRGHDTFAATDPGDPDGR